MLHRILREKLAELKLGIVQRSVTGDISGHICLFTCINEHFLSVDDKFVVAEVATYDNIVASNEGTYLVLVESLVFNDLDMGRRGNSNWDFAGIPTVAPNDNVRVFEQMGGQKAGEFACNTSNSTVDSHGKFRDKLLCVLRT